METINILLNHKTEIIAGLSFLYTLSVTLASVIVKWAPNSTEGKYSEIFLDFCNTWAINNKTRQEGKE